PDIARRGADIVPVRALGDHEAVVGGVGGIALVPGFIERLLVILVPDVGQAFEEQQWEDVLLVVAGIDEAAQQRGRAPEIAFKFALGQPAHCNHPPSTSTLRRWSSAARASASAVLKASTASGSGGMSWPMGGMT